MGNTGDGTGDNVRHLGMADERERGADGTRPTPNAEGRMMTSTMMRTVSGTPNEEHSHNPGGENGSAAKPERARDRHARKVWRGKAKAIACNLLPVLAHVSESHDHVHAGMRRLKEASGRLAWQPLTWITAQAVLLVAMSAATLGPLAPSAMAQDVVDLPRNWRLTPGEVELGEEFRVMFVTSSASEANSDDINTYNNFVQTRAASGHSEIRQFSSRFRVLGSTSTVDARDNTASTHTAADKGLAIYWVNGVKIAEDYEDFYDGSWISTARPRTERGLVIGGTGQVRVNTGTNNDGTKHTDHLGGSGEVRVGAVRDTGTSPLSEASTTREARALYALSPVLRLTPIAMPTSVSIVSTPQHAQGYRRGEQIRIEIDFGEAIHVQHPPYIVLDIGGTARRANYASGSGTQRLVFAYTVAQGDSDTNGVSLCDDETKDRSCGRIALSTRTAIVSTVDHNRVGVNLPALGNQAAHKVNGFVNVNAVTITSSPASGTTYNAGETIAVQLDFGEAVSVTGTPYVTLNIGGGARRAAYASGSGTRYATFEYTVVRADFDADGVALCAKRTLDPGCARIALDGGTIRAVSDRVAVELTLPTLNAQSRHKVDGSRGPTTPPTANPGPATVPHGWALIPEGVTGPFRLLFVSSTTRNAESADINDYNDHVISAAGAGHTDIQAYKNGFRAIGSTEAVDAKDNAGLTGTGVPIYWLNGAKVADDYPDLLDSMWDSETWHTEAGGVGSTSAKTVWTGSHSSGTALAGNTSFALGAEGQTEAGRGGLNTSGSPIGSFTTTRTNLMSLYGLSQVLDTTGPKYEETQISSSPRAGGTYREGETITIGVKFSERIVVRGAPTLALNLAGTAQAPGAGIRSMRYAETNALFMYFQYVVQTGDFTGGGTTPLTISANAGESPITLAGATIRSEQSGHAADLRPAGAEAYQWTSLENHRVDARGPIVTQVEIVSSPASNGSYAAGETITVQLTTRQRMRVTGAPYIEIDTSGGARRANFVGTVGEATNTLEFEYTVQANDYDGDGISVLGTVHFNGGSIRSADDPRRLVLLSTYAPLGDQFEHRVNRERGAPTGTVSSGCSGTSTVSGGWPWIPEGLGWGDKFRLLFVTTGTTNAESADINEYNRWVQDQAGNGAAATRSVKTHFRALGSTEAVDARDNVCVSGAGGEKIYWLGGEKVADNNADFKDGTFDSTRQKDQFGRDSNKAFVVTGSDPNWLERFGGDNKSHALGNSANGLFGSSGVAVYTFAHPTIARSVNKLHLNGMMALSLPFQIETAAQAAHTDSIRAISTPAIGDTYRAGETIEIEVTYSEPVSVDGTPRIGLAVATHDVTYLVGFEAVYLRGSGTNKLVFGWEVDPRAADDSGVQLTGTDGLAHAWRPSGGSVNAVGDGYLAAWTLTDWLGIPNTKVDGRLSIAGGICTRTKGVRDAIVAKVADATDCSQVSASHLAALTGTLTIENLASIEASDLAGLSALTTLELNNNTFTAVPVGLLDETDALTTLRMNGNTLATLPVGLLGELDRLRVLEIKDSGLETLPVGLFDGLRRVTSIDLSSNEIEQLPREVLRGLDTVTELNLENNAIAAEGLPDAVFEPLIRAEEVKLSGNPGDGSWDAQVEAGPAQIVSAQEMVALAGQIEAGPWGSNTRLQWMYQYESGVEGATLTIADSGTLSPTFRAPTFESQTSITLTLDVGAPRSAARVAPAHDSVVITVKGLAATDLEIISEPVSGLSEYRRGEVIEIALGFNDLVLVNTSQGTPVLPLTIGTGTRNAAYARGSETNQLVFQYTVGATDVDTDGISVAANSLRVEGGTITGVWGATALLGHEALATQAEHKVDGPRRNTLTGGICGRTPEIRDRLVELVRTAQSDNTMTCAQVTNTHLNGLTVDLNLSGGTNGVFGGKKLSGLKTGDFAGLNSIDNVYLDENRLRDIPAGVFDPMTGLRSISLTKNKGSANDGLTTLPKGLFDKLTDLRSIGLNDNDLTRLPARIFEKLTNVLTIGLGNNPGDDKFVPTARAGEDQVVTPGTTVVLGDEGAERGYDDPWGSNIESWSWVQTAGTPVTPVEGKGANTARPQFTAGTTSENLSFELTVTAAGDDTRTATDTVNIEVRGAPRIEEVWFAGTPRGLKGNQRTYGLNEWIDVGFRYDRAMQIDTTRGTPAALIEVGTSNKRALYRRGTGTAEIIFGYRVQSTDRDTDGVALVANSLTLNGGSITGVSDRAIPTHTHSGLTGGSNRTVDGSVIPGSSGICARTPAVAAAIVAKFPGKETCSDVRQAELASVTGRLDVSAEAAEHGRITALRNGDFAGLTGVTELDLDYHAIAVIPATVFNPLSALTTLSMAYNQTRGGTRMRTLPSGLFDALTGLRVLRLEQNDLEALPDNLFEPLTSLRTLTLEGNPGSAEFVPRVRAGPEGGVDAEGGDRVTLSAEAGPNPWGNNVTYAWSRGEGTTQELSEHDVARPEITVVAAATATVLEYSVVATGRGTNQQGSDQVSIRVGPTAAVTGVEIISTPADGGSEYHAGETVEIGLEFTRPVVVTGDPGVVINFGGSSRFVDYNRGSRTSQLIFAYTIASTDGQDADGIWMTAGVVNTDVGTVMDASGRAAILAHPALRAQSGHAVDATTQAGSTGICTRSPAVRDELLDQVRENESDTTLTCASVTQAHLAALTGRLNLATYSAGVLRPEYIRNLKAGDFAGLNAITSVEIHNNRLRTFPAGIFDPMTALTKIQAEHNNLEELPAGLFDRVTGLTTLSLDSNNLASLPARIFERLTSIENLSVSSNPGSARFTPTARAGEDIVSRADRSVTLGVEGAENGFDDPWGSNVTYEWTQVEPVTTGATLEQADTARARVRLTENDRTHGFRLTVTGAGTAGERTRTISSSDEVKITVGAPPTPTSATVEGKTLTLTYGEELETANPTSAPGKGAIYVATVRTADETRSLTTARGAKPRARGETVTMEVTPPVKYGERVTLSYEPDNATQATRVRDTAGNLADGFAGFEVENQTPEPAHVDSVAFADSASTYAIGDAIAVDLTFSETVNVTGTPTVDLEIGTETRQASYASGSGTTVLRFAYTVAEGDLESAGLTISANGLKTPAGSTIRTSVGNEAATPTHESLRSADHKVDGVRPTIAEADLSGPFLTLTWSEALIPEDDALRPEAFTVKVNGTAEPTPRSVVSDTVNRRMLRVTLTRSIRAGTRGITLDYNPGSTALKDFAGNAVDAISEQGVTGQTGGDVPATGVVTVTGTARVGQTLTATLADVVDLDGLAETPVYTFTWLRVEGANESVITTTRTDQARSRYTLTDADVTKKVKAKVEFEDYVGNDETLQSDAFPAVGSIGAAIDSACPTPNLSGRELLWTATMTVGLWEVGNRQKYGYHENVAGMLSDDTVVIDGTEYMIAIIENDRGTKILFETNHAIALTSLAGLRLDICKQRFALNNPYEKLFELYPTGTDDWSTRSTIQLYLSKPDVTPPALQKIEVDGATLTLTYDEVLKVTSPTPASAFTIGVVGGGTLTASNVRAGVGTDRNKVTMTLDPPAEHGQTHTVAYAAGSATAATKIQDVNNNAAAAFTQAPVVVRNATPEGPHIDAIAFAGNAQTAAIGDAIGVNVTFSEAVTITGSPRLRLQIGSEGVWAQWKGGQSSRTVHPFEYSVVEGDIDSDGATIEGSTLEAPAGSTIRTTATNEEVALSHATVHDAARPVDALRPNAAESGAVTVTGHNVTVTWSEPLDENATPQGAGGFRLRVPGTTDPVVTQVALTGAVATLTLDNAVTDGTQGVTLEYNPPSGTKIQDVAGNAATAFSARNATVAADTRAPEVTDTVVENATLTVTFDEPLSGTTAPAAAFSVRVTRKGNVVDGYTVSTASIDNAGTVLTLTLSQAVRALDVVRLTYTKPGTGPMQDRATPENLVENFEIEVDRNLTAGVREITFENTEEKLAIGKLVSVNVWFTRRVILTGNATGNAKMTVLVGTQRRQARHVETNGNVVLIFDYFIADGDEDTDGIEIPANALSMPVGSGIVTEMGRESVSLEHDAVEPDPRHVVDGVRPSVAQSGAIAVAGPMVTVTWSEALDEGSIPADDGGFTLRVAGTKHANVTNVAIAGTTMTLTLDASLADGTQDVTLDYTPPSGTKVRDVRGNTAAAFSGPTATVTADTRAPQVASASVDGAALTITFDEALSGTTAATSAFAVSVTRGGATVSGITVSAAAIDSAGTTLTLTLSEALRRGDDVKVTYTAPATNKLQDRATVANAVANFETGTAGAGYQVPAVENTTPGVRSVSFAGTAKALGIGDKVEIDVTFSEAVTVTTSASARPQVAVLVGFDTFQARYVSGSGSATLRFEDEVVEDVEDTDGISIAANALNVPSGSTLTTENGNRTVQLTHEAVAADTKRTVDGVRPGVTDPGSVSVAGPTITVTWTEALDEGAVPSGAGGFAVQIAGTAGPAVTRVTVSGSTTTLTLASAIANGTQNVTLDYTPPSGTKIQDVAGNGAEPFSGRTASVMADTRAPQLAGGVVDGGIITLTFDETLAEAALPARSAFNMTVTRGGSSISGITVQSVARGIGAEQVGLWLTQAVRSSDEVVVSYTAPSSNPLRDRATTPNNVANFETGSAGAGYQVPAIENVTVSVDSVTFAGTAESLNIGDKVKIDVSYSEAVSVPTSASAQPRIGVLIGNETRQARYASGTGSTTLRFEYVVAEGDEDTDGIEIEANALNISSGNPIKTRDRSRNAQIGHDAVAADTARTVDGVRPTVAETGAVAVEGGTVTVTWSKTLDETSVPSGTGGFIVKVAAAAGPAVTQVAIAGATTTLTLDTAIANGTQDVTLDYSPPASNEIRDTNGNAAAAFSARSATVTPDTRAPEITGGSVDGATVRITFDKALSGTTVPVAAFSVSVIRAGSTVSGVSVDSGSVSSTSTTATMTLTLSQAVRGGDEVVLRYSAPSTGALQDRATPANAVADFETGSSSAGYDVPAIRNGTPSVIGIAFAGTARALGIGDKVEVDATFTEAVRVTTSASARPEIEVLIGTETRKARYVSGSGSTSLRFEYVVIENDEDSDGIEIGASALSAPAGSTIRTQGGNRAVELGHSAVSADSARTVDGVRPTVRTAQAEGPTVTVTWSEALDETSVPEGAGGMRIRFGNTNGPAVNSVSVTGSTSVLTLASAIAEGTQDVTLEYDATRATPRLRDSAGNAAASIPRADAQEVQVGDDTRAPEVAGPPSVDGRTLTVTFDERLDADSIPAAPGGFGVTLTRSGANVPNVTVSALNLDSAGTTLRLTLSEPVRGLDTVVLAYTPPSANPLQDRATTANTVAAFTTGANGVPAVVNQTPSVKSVAFTGTARALRLGETIAVEAVFTEAVRVGTSGSARPQIALSIGVETRQARYARGSGSDTLVFEYTVASGDEDGDGIDIAANALTIPTGSSIRTQAGNRTVQLAHDAVGRDGARTVDASPPQAQAAEAEGQTVIVRWSEAIDEASERSDAGGFVLRYGGAQRPAVTAVAVDDTDSTRVLLTIDAAIPDGTQGVTLGWAPPSSGVPIRDLAGNTGVAFSEAADRLAVSVTADTAAPTLSSATIGGRVLTLTFSEPLDEGSVPAANQFTITVQRDGNAVGGESTEKVEVTGAVVTLTLANGVLGGDAVTVTYAKPTQNALRDRAVTPNEVAAFTTGSSSVAAVVNTTAALDATLSQTTVTEGTEAEVELTVSVGSGQTTTADRLIEFTATGSAVENSDWAPNPASGTLAAGEDSMTLAISIIDDAVLESEESITLAVTADGVAFAQVTLTIVDDDRAVLAVVGPEEAVEEGGNPATLKLRLEPHADNAQVLPAADACIVDFPVAATLSVTENAGELTGTPPLPMDVSFPATSLDDCTREVSIELETRASDGEWEPTRTVSFELAPKTGQDERVTSGTSGLEIIDDTAAPGPVITRIGITPVPPEATAEYTAPRRMDDFKAVPEAQLHGRGATLSFAAAMSAPVTVTANEDTGEWPELVLDVFGRERRATLGAERNNTTTLVFEWTVALGDNDPDGIAVKRVDLNGATVRFASGCEDAGGGAIACDLDLEDFSAEHGARRPLHRIRGGFFSIELAIDLMEENAREGSTYRISLRRNGAFDEDATATLSASDTGFEAVTGRALNFKPEGELTFQGETSDGRTAHTNVIVKHDGTEDAERTLTIRIGTTDSRHGGLTNWYERGPDAVATVTVVEGEPVEGETEARLSVGPAVAHEPESGTTTANFRICLWKNKGCPGAREASTFHDFGGFTHEVRVEYATADGTAVAGEDYVATTGTLVFAPGETVKTVEVVVMADAHDEGEETFWLELANPVGAELEQWRNFAYIHNNGPIPKAWITRFGRTVAEQVLDAVDTRMDAVQIGASEVSIAGAQVRLDNGAGGNTQAEGEGGAEDDVSATASGQRDATGSADGVPRLEWMKSWAEEEAERDELGPESTETISTNQLFTSTAFSLSAGTPGEHLVGTWGRTAISSFDARDGELLLDGEVTSVMLGADWTSGSGRGGWSAGLIASHSDGEGTWSGGIPGGDAEPGISGEIEATLSGIFPWARYAVTEDVDAWASAGLGQGTLQVTPNKPGTDEPGAQLETELSLRMAALGLRGTLLAGGAQNITLRGKTDAMIVETQSARTTGMKAAKGTVSRLRAAVEGTRTINVEGLGSLTPSTEIGVRHDAGDAETGWGLDVGGGIAIADSSGRLQAELRGRGLLSHEAAGLKERGWSGTLGWREKADSDRGVSLSLDHSVGGTASGGADALLSRTTLDDFVPSANEEEGESADLQNQRLDLTIGYGLSALGGRFTATPEARMGFSENHREFGASWRLTQRAGGNSLGSLELSIEATRNEGTTGDTTAENRIALRLNARF